MSAAVTLAGLGVSLAALAWIAAGDPKRLRAFRRPVVVRRGVGLAWALALAPGVLVPLWGGSGGFFVWLGAATVAGWAMAAVSPDRVAATRAALLAAAEAAAARLAAAVGPAAARARGAWSRLRSFGTAALPRPVPGDGRYAEMERRLRELEAEVAVLRRAAGGGGAPAGAEVIELSRPAGRR